jgi:anti-anti-sigma regulatory factor
MPLYDVPVVLPYRLRDDPDGALYSIQVRTIASNAKVALSISQALVQTLATLRHPDRAIEVLSDRAKIGVIGQQIDGPYAYVINRGSHIHSLQFPARIDSHSGEIMGNAFAGIDTTTLYCVLMDCYQLSYINTAGLASIAGHTKRLRLRLFRLSDPLRKVLEIVGLMRVLNVHPTLSSALADLIAEQTARTAVT